MRICKRDIFFGKGKRVFNAGGCKNVRVQETQARLI